MAPVLRYYSAAKRPGRNLSLLQAPNAAGMLPIVWMPAGGRRNQAIYGLILIVVVQKFHFTRCTGQIIPGLYS